MVKNEKIAVRSAGFHSKYPKTVHLMGLSGDFSKKPRFCYLQTKKFVIGLHRKNQFSEK